ncbi:carboxylating nicotinate-nucleotide diphosphorylase [Aliifodinibius salicampi]|uniref:nicotinate-nucleotide diphosphorylase (carboxylating) n=1 Tax=Fodinibius salicampi TaxID=1920655 RepID=A0ABT3Q334_9BACT|nr:carboxylating nicotinate-nucleotide diphosphorylase [Fodinibius salicampi]MCW9714527.1 carboxylating nicotinate-nucleotide diphosphorylase [Fodinibius salicampi]
MKTPLNIQGRPELQMVLASETQNMDEAIANLVERAFEEDIQSGDVTTNAIIDNKRRAHAVWTAKDKGIISGLDIAETVFRKLDPDLKWNPYIEEGDEIKEGTEIIGFRGLGRALLTGERIALNIVQRMSGIATKTNRFVSAIKGLETDILDTRKTVPGLRLLDKYAVKAGGGKNHRMGLYDLAMIKDNHIVAAGSINKAVKQVREKKTNLEIEVEVKDLSEVEQALEARADIIMLDNMTPALMKEAVARIDGQARVEASGNITLNNVREVAKTGVDYISVGALTHSVQAFDISQTLQHIS